MPVTVIELPVKFELRVEPDVDGILVYCEGEITAGETSHAFHSAIVDLVQRHTKVTVDLRGVRQIDRMGLATLVGLYSSAHIAKSSLRFTNLVVNITDTCPCAHQNKIHKRAS